MEEIAEAIRNVKGLTINEHLEGNSAGYNLTDELGTGNFGEVKLAEHIDTGKLVAIKILNKAEVEQKNDFERVLKEVEILSVVSHPNIIFLYEIIDEEEFYFIVTEYCSGGNLDNLLKKKRKFSEQQAAEFLWQILSALEYCHTNGIAHRDVKPENILMDNNEKLKVIDFGLGNFYNRRERLKTPCGSP